jgi:hypothetical protein
MKPKRIRSESISHAMDAYPTIARRSRRPRIEYVPFRLHFVPILVRVVETGAHAR